MKAAAVGVLSITDLFPYVDYFENVFEIENDNRVVIVFNRNLNQPDLEEVVYWQDFENFTYED